MNFQISKEENHVDVKIAKEKLPCFLKRIDMIDSDEDSIVRKNYIAMKEIEKSNNSSHRSSPRTNHKKGFKIRRLNSITSNYVIFISKLKEKIKKMHNRIYIGETINASKSSNKLVSLGYPTCQSYKFKFGATNLDSSKLKIEDEAAKTLKSTRSQITSTPSNCLKSIPNQNKKTNAFNDFSFFLKTQSQSKKEIEDRKKKSKNNYQKMLVNVNSKFSHKDIKLAYSLNRQKSKSYYLEEK